MSERQFTNKLTFSIYGKYQTINIGVGTIRALGLPSHITILTGIRHQSIAIVPCEPSHVMSFKVPENFMKMANVKFTIRSKAFTKEVIRFCGLDPESKYTFEGEFEKNHNRVIFAITSNLQKANRKTKAETECLSAVADEASSDSEMA